MIQVNVTGKAGSGKSTVALVIAQALRKAGITTTVKFLDGESETDVEWSLDRKLESISNEEVLITESCTRV